MRLVLVISPIQFNLANQLPLSWRRAATSRGLMPFPLTATLELESLLEVPVPTKFLPRCVFEAGETLLDAEECAQRRDRRVIRLT
jgi:hypothetical protein